MIVLKKVRWQNFLSTGAYITEVSLDDSKTTLVCGDNAAGKSTIMDAVCYGLFGKPFRKINRPQLINSITNKNMLVEVEFQTNNTEYLIRRGLKPAIFEIYANGNLIDQSADKRDYQSILESTVLKINLKTFCQKVLIGSANFTPFMQLNAADRRKVIEDLLDLQVFSKMNIVLKQRVQVNKDAIQENQSNITLAKRTIDLYQTNNEQLRKNNEQTIESKQKQIAEYNKVISAALQQIEYNQQCIAPMAATAKNRVRDEANLDRADEIKDMIEKALEGYNTQLQFYQTATHCQTCQQEITAEFKSAMVDKCAHSIAINDDKLNKCLGAIEKLNNSILYYNDLDKQIHKLLAENEKSMTTINLNNKLIKTIQQEIDNLKDASINFTDVEPYIDQLNELNDVRSLLLEQRELYNVAVMLLKDGGIKATIIKQYIPVINKLINKYLEHMEFFCQFEVNENFEETIRARYRDESSYESFSEGEKMRIDLALLFTWREIARMRNSNSVNLLILDEIMDSSLDASGTDEFLKIIQTLTSTNNVIIISHKSDQIQDKFEKIIRFEKHKNFSRIKVTEG